MKIQNSLFLFLILTSFLLPQNKIAVVHFIEGSSVIRNTKYDGRSIEVVVGRNIYDGDIIKVHEYSNCFIRFIDDKTHIQLSPNSIIKIRGDQTHKKIELIKGNIYIKNLYNKNDGTYIFTKNNQIYLSNHRMWISTNDEYLDQIFSLDTPVEVYNANVEKIFNVESRYLLNIYNGDFTYLDNISEIVPDHVLSDIRNFNYNKDEIELVKYDLIPIYGERVLNKEFIDPYNLSFDFGTKFLNTSTHLKLGLYPQYQKNNLFISMNIEFYTSPSGNDMGGDWDDLFDIVDKVQLSYSYNNSNNDMKLKLGEINNISFGSGYMLNNISNTIDYPRRRYSGLLLDYTFDIDFMDFKLIVPSIRDFQNSGGIIGARTSLFISHNFPLTLGFGFVADMNQFSTISDYLKINSAKRIVYGAEFDFNYNLVSNLDFQMNLFGEAVGLWYPDYNYYLLSDDADVSDDLRWRKGTWGINAPGISLKFDNRYSFNISLNYNSSTFIPNYFNSTYLYNRARYYKANLEQIQFNNDFPLVQKQINSLNNNFLVNCDSEAADAECVYLIPKDVYPILFSNNGFSPYDTYGFSTEFIYNFHSYIDVSIKTSIFVENSDASNSYYTFQTNLNINNGFIRNLEKLKLYYSNIFFAKFSDSNRMNYGIEAEVELPLRLSLIINLGQVYYDSNNIIDNNIDKMTNSSINLKYNF